MTAILDTPATVPTADPDVPPRRARLGSRAWDRIGLGVLLAATAATYLWNITVNGMGNQFYAAAAQAG